NEEAMVYVAIDTRLPKPFWMDSSWIDTGLTLTNNESGGPHPQALYARPFYAGTVVLGPDTKSGTSALMYTVVLVPLFQITNLSVKDTTHAASWSIQSNLRSGNVQYGDASTTITSVPASLAGAEWIRTANASTAYTGNPTVTFSINQEA